MTKKDNPLAEIRAAYKALANDAPNSITTMRALTALGNAIEEIQTLQVELARRAPSAAEPNALAIVNEQAEDKGLWFVPKYASEDYLQEALRRLHEAVEGKTREECARSAMKSNDIPELCTHDDPSWCTEECVQKARAVWEWQQNQQRGRRPR